MLGINRRVRERECERGRGGWGEYIILVYNRLKGFYSCLYRFVKVKVKFRENKLC